ncbi:hypothetical protein MCEMSE15_00626 [Fimbriimonadaceae bacterium]
MTMGIFGDIGKAVGGFARGTVGVLGDAWDLIKSGASEVGDFGTRSLPSITLKHNVNVSGRISIEGNFNVKFDLSDLVTASENIRDGLLNFDVFGGASRQLAGQARDNQALVGFLKDFRETVDPVRPMIMDDYVVEITFINKSTAVNQSFPGRPLNYITPSPCSAFVAVRIGPVRALGDAILKIEGSTKPADYDHSVIQRTVSVVGLSKGQNSIRILYGSLGEDAASKAAFANSKLHVRLIRSRENTKQVLVEVVLNGGDLPRSISLPFFLDDPVFSPAPFSTAKTAAMRKALDTSILSLKVPNTPSPNPGSITSVVDLISKTLLQSAHDRIDTGDRLQLMISQLDDDDPNTFDVRTPFFLSIFAASGPTKLKVASISNPDVSQVVNLVRDELMLLEGDEIVIRLPLVAGLSIPRDKIKTQQISVQLEKLEGWKDTQVSLEAGFEWNRRLLTHQSLNTSMIGDNPGTRHTINLSDVLGGSPKSTLYEEGTDWSLFDTFEVLEHDTPSPDGCQSATSARLP